MLARRATWFGLAFAAAGGAAFEGAGSVAGPFLIDRGLESATVGAFFALPSVACMLVGALTVASSPTAWATRAPCARPASSRCWPCSPRGHGIRGQPRHGLRRHPRGGLRRHRAASTYALFMDLCEPDIGSTQFSAFMGATNLCEAWAAWTVARIAGRIGYPEAFVTLAAVSLVATLPAAQARHPSEAARELAKMTPQYLELFPSMAIEYNVDIIGGSSFSLEGDDLKNAAYLFRPDGSIEKQDEIHVTPSERHWWGVQPGGNLPFVDNADMHYSQSGIFTPADVSFARDGIAAECTPNIETLIIHDVDLEQLRRQRKTGTVQNWNDRRLDLYRVRYRAGGEGPELDA